MGVRRRNIVPQILDAAEQIFAARGLTGTRVEDIARICDIPKANILYYFGTKEDLYRATLFRVLELWLADADDWLLADKAPLDAIEGYVRAKIGFSASRPDASSLFSQELLSGAQIIRPFLENELRAHVDRRAEIFLGWQRAGLMVEIDPRHFLVLLWSMTQAYADMRVQFQAVLGKAHLARPQYETGVRTVMTMVSSLFPRPSAAGTDEAPPPRKSRRTAKNPVPLVRRPEHPRPAAAAIDDIP